MNQLEYYQDLLYTIEKKIDNLGIIPSPYIKACLTNYDKEIIRVYIDYSDFLKFKYNNLAYYLIE